MSLLPYDYEVEYLECTGTQYIDTGLALVESTDVVSVTMAEPVLRANGYAWGCRRSGATSYIRGARFYDNNSGVRAYLDYTGGTAAATSFGVAQVGELVQLTCDFPNTSWTCKSESGTFGPKGTVNTNILLFSSGLSDALTASIRVSNFAVTRSGNAVIDLIPVVANGEACMYDRVSGQLFGNAGTGAFIAGPRIKKFIPLINLWGGVERARTARDYVQDGLIAMWDGIENAGWGVHDASATAWNDLAGSNDLTIQGNGTWSENCLACSDGNQYAAVGAGYNIDTILHLEIVLNVKTPYNDSVNSVVASFIKGFGFGLSLERNNGLLFNGGQPTFAYDFGSKALSASYEYGKNVASINGHDVTARGVYDTWSSFVDGTFLGNYVTGLRPFVGDIYSIRLYSRALTASEIAANYEVDKARFVIGE